MTAAIKAGRNNLRKWYTAFTSSLKKSRDNQGYRAWVRKGNGVDRISHCLAGHEPAKFLSSDNGFSIGCLISGRIHRFGSGSKLSP
jgi:hypothetical protein